jgi:hypothetical protein
MVQVIVSIEPIQGGWCVLSPLSGAPLMFLSGDHAEEQAHRLAELAGSLGWEAEIRFHHREGEIFVQACGAAKPTARGALTPKWHRSRRVLTTHFREAVSRQGSISSIASESM